MNCGWTDASALTEDLFVPVYARRIPLWREEGYRVKLFFLRLPTPEAVIRRRFDAGWRNFEQVYQGLVDGWALYDNSGGEPKLLVEESRV